MNAKVNIPELKISYAALGRRLATTILKAKEQDLDPESFRDTVTAVLALCTTRPYVSRDHYWQDRGIVKAETIEIEKSVRRREIALKAARRRRELREAREKLASIEREKGQMEIRKEDRIFSPDDISCGNARKESTVSLRDDGSCS